MSNPEYHTNDLNLSAFLITRGYELLRVDGDAGRRLFVFDGGARAVAPEFFKNAPVGARDFASAIRQLKTAIHTL